MTKLHVVRESRGDLIRYLRHKNGRGQSLVEFALILPILITLLLLTIDVGRLFYAYVGVANGSREGAAYAITSAAAAVDTTTITSRARQELAANVDATGYAVTSTCTPSCTTDSTVKVSVSTTFAFLFPILLPNLQVSDSATGVIQ